MNQNVIVLRLNQNECNSQLTTIRQNIVTINSNIQSNTTALRRHGGTKEDKGNQIVIKSDQSRGFKERSTYRRKTKCRKCFNSTTKCFTQCL